MPLCSYVATAPVISEGKMPGQMVLTRILNLRNKHTSEVGHSRGHSRLKSAGKQGTQVDR